MDTRAVADQLGTDPKTLRRFIRSRACPFDAVGAGGRYDFTPDDIPVMADAFTAWSAGPDAPKPAKAVKSATSRRGRKTRTQAEIDAEVWAEEGPVVLPEINAHLRAAAQRRIDRLEELLMARGQHISQRVGR